MDEERDKTLLGPEQPGSSSEPRSKRVRVRRRKKRKRSKLSHRIRKGLDRVKVDPAGMQAGLDRLIQVILVAMVVLAPLPLGSVAQWARSVLFVCACLLLVLWIAREALMGRVEIVRTPIWFLVVGYLLILSLQLIPLPQGILSFVSPHTEELYARLLPGYPEQTGPMPLSVNPHATTQEIYRVATFAILLFVLLNHLRRKSQVSVLLWALVAVGAFESLYGLAERFSGNPHIFWITPPEDVSVRGTYLNRNHFAGLTEMVTPVVLGFLMALGGTRGSSYLNSKQPIHKRLVQGLSKGRGYAYALLAMLAGTLLVAGIFSLSRAGMMGLLVGMSVLLLSGGGGERKRRALLVLSVLVLLTLGAVFFRGMDHVIDRFERLTEEGTTAGWSARAELRQAGFQLFQRFPVFGSGGGTYGDVSLMDQPALFGDKIALYLHCDWLQVACETGVVGALILYSAAGFLVFSFLRKIRRRSDPYSRWIASGAFAGMVAMLVHSLFDFNLYMVTANGLIFVVLVAICHAAVHMKGRLRGSEESFSFWAIPLSSTGARVLLPGIVLLVCTAASLCSARMGLADANFSRYLSWVYDEPAPYYFWKSPRMTLEQAKEELGRAARLDPDSPEVNFHQGLFLVKDQEEKIQAIARETAINMIVKAHTLMPLDEEVEEPVQVLVRDITRNVKEHELSIDEESEGFEGLVSSFLPLARRKLQEEAEGVIRRTEPFFISAVRGAPTVPWHHTDRVMARENLLPEEVWLEQERPLQDKLVRNGLFLAPNRPRTHYLAGSYALLTDLAGSAGTEGLSEGAKREILENFRKALEGEPRQYGEMIYPLLMDRAGMGPETLVGLTPHTYLNQMQLYRFFMERRMWGEALESLETLLKLLRLDPDTKEGIAAGLPLAEKVEEMYARLGRERLALLRRIGLQEAWENEKAKAEAFADVHCEELLRKAMDLKRLSRLEEAKKCCSDCLDLDLGHKEARLTLLEIETLPGRLWGPGSMLQTLVGLFHFLRQERNLSPEDCERLDSILSRLEPASPSEHLYFHTARALREVCCGRYQDASNILQALLLVDAPAFRYWPQRHLIHYYLGRAREGAERKPEAGEEYMRALRLTLSHRASLARLAALGEADAILDFHEESADELLPGTEETSPDNGTGEEESAPAEEPSFPLPETRESVSEEVAHELLAMTRIVLKGMEEEEGVSAVPEGPVTDLAEEAPLSVGERLADLTPEVPWNIGFSDSFTLLGLTLGTTDASPSEVTTEASLLQEDVEGQADEKGGDEPAGVGEEVEEAEAQEVEGFGFVVRYYWRVEEEMDPRDYEIRYRYFDREGNLTFEDIQFLLADQEPSPQNLDGGIGTVLLQWHYLPLPPDGANCVEIRVRKKLEEKGFAPPLVSGTGETSLVLGLKPPEGAEKPQRAALLPPQ